MTMRTVATLLALAVVMPGCTSDEKVPTVLPPAPSTSASPTGGPMSEVPIPPEATAETQSGASAFARYYFSVVVNQAYKDFDTRAVTALSGPQCNSCKNIVSDIDRLRSEGRKVAGERFVIEFAETAPTASDGSAIVDFRYAADRYLEVDQSGVVVRDVPPRVKQDAQVKLVRSGDGWLVSGIRLVEAG